MREQLDEEISRCTESEEKENERPDRRIGPKICIADEMCWTHGINKIREITIEKIMKVAVQCNSATVE